MWDVVVELNGRSLLLWSVSAALVRLFCLSVFPGVGCSVGCVPNAIEDRQRGLMAGANSDSRVVHRRASLLAVAVAVSFSIRVPSENRTQRATVAQLSYLHRILIIAHKKRVAWLKQVAAAIQRGDEPPGIRVVEDRLSADAQSLATPSQPSPSPPKPWEVFAGAAATGVVSAENNRGVVGERAAGDGVGNGGRGYGSGEDGTRPQHAVSVGP